ASRHRRSWTPREHHDKIEAVAQAQDCAIEQDTQSKAVPNGIGNVPFFVPVYNYECPVSHSCPVFRSPLSTRRSRSLIGLLDDKAGEQLRQREIVPGELRAVLGKGLARQIVGDQHHLPWRFAGQHDSSNTSADAAPPDRTEQRKTGSRQSRTGFILNPPELPMLPTVPASEHENRTTLSLNIRRFIMH
ncbi:MAG: hypothetical protein JWN24_99, partial [Phycisphaerales bacterium]|nr:hypothetical protein [Phycisphaerales bacterium]